MDDPPEAGTAPAQAQTVEADVEQVQRFDVWEYRVRGNTRADKKAIERAVYPYLGPDKSIDDVEAARQNLERLYRDSGYGTVLVDIPEQDVVGGIVTLVVVEGAVERLRISGSRYFSLGRIREKVPALAEGSVPYLPQVQAQLTALNRLSTDRTITPILRPGKTPGKLEVELKVEDQLPLHGNVEINNRFSRDTSELRLNAGVSYHNLWQKEHSFAFNFQVAPINPDEVTVYSGTYSFRLPDANKVIALYGVRTSSDVATVGTLGVIGSGLITGIRGTVPLASFDDYFHSLILGADYKDFDESIGLQGADTLNTPIDYLVFSGGYSATEFGEKNRTQLSVTATFAFRGLGNTPREFEEKRFQATPGFFYVRGDLSRSQDLYRGASLFGRLSGQASQSPLISNEQFSAGGVDSVRGYLESEVLGDDGVYGSLELRSPSFAEKIWSELQDLRLHTYVDGAYLRVQDALPGQERDAILYSTGVGVRLAGPDGVAANLDWAYPLQTSGTTDKGDSKVHFSVGYEF